MSKLCQQLPVELARVRAEKRKEWSESRRQRSSFRRYYAASPPPCWSVPRPIGADAGEGRDDARMRRVVGMPVDGRGMRGWL